jgi:hypothetical protein
MGTFRSQRNLPNRLTRFPRFGMPPIRRQLKSFSTNTGNRVCRSLSPGPVEGALETMKLKNTADWFMEQGAYQAASVTDQALQYKQEVENSRQRYYTLRPEYQEYQQEVKAVQGINWGDDQYKQDIQKAIDDKYGIIGHDGLPNLDGINPKTGKPNIAGRDVDETDKYIIANLVDSGFTPEQTAAIYIKLKQTNGNVSGQFLLDIGAVKEPTWFENLVGMNPDGFASLVNTGYRLAYDGATLAELSMEDIARRSMETQGVIFLAAMGGVPELDVIGKIGKAKAAIGARLSINKGLNNGVLDKANFAQKDYSETFSVDGIRIFSKAAGRPIRTISDLTNALKNGDILLSQVPIDYIIRDGNTLILNTRSSQALERAGIPRNQWYAVNRTGNALYEGMLSDQLTNNGLTSVGVPSVSPKKGGSVNDR